MAVAALSFVGLGAQPPTPSWGAMIAEGRDLLRVAPWVSLFPGLAIGLTVLVWLDGTARVLPKNASFPRPARVRARFGAPAQHAPAQLDDKASWRVAAAQVREAVSRLRPTS